MSITPFLPPLVNWNLHWQSLIVLTSVVWSLLFFYPLFSQWKKKKKTLLCQCKVFKINHSLTKSSYILKQIYVKEGSDIYSFFHLYGRVNLLAAGAQVGNKLPMMKKLQIITLSWTQCSGNPISYPCCSSVPATWEESWRILKWE